MLNTKRNLFFLLFLCSLSLLVGTTYAWVSAKDEHINQVSAPEGQIKISIEGNKSPLFLMPNKINDRKIKIHNMSEQSVFVRVSMEEVLASFEVDVEDVVGNGDLKNYADDGLNHTPTVVEEDVSTWQTDAYYQMNDKLIKINQLESLKNDNKKRSDNLELIQISLPNVLEDYDGAKHDYWLYEDGYFYYSEKLPANSDTAIFMDKVKIPSNLPNALKGSLYQQIYDAEGVLASDVAFDFWQISSTSPVYQMLNATIK